MRPERRAKMPIAGDREAYVASMVGDAINNPKALFLTAVGVACSTPSEAAKVGETLGLTGEELKSARWIAIFKRGKSKTDFLKRLLEITEQADKKTAEKPRETTAMAKTQVQKGSGYYEAKIFEFLSEIFGAKRSSITIYEATEALAFVRGSSIVIYIPDVGWALEVRSPYDYLIGDSGLVDKVELRMNNSCVLDRTKKLKKRLESFTKRTQEKPTEFILVQDYS